MPGAIILIDRAAHALNPWIFQLGESGTFSFGLLLASAAPCPRREVAEETGIREHMEYRWVDHEQATAPVTPRVKRILD
ncbi:MAG TPA: hypothetical protein VGV16_00785 [Gammaproteobacteria bacterium]|nr:hypothetical protein [Gammaproteobacteria bacterium]